MLYILLFMTLEQTPDPLKFMWFAAYAGQIHVNACSHASASIH